jgi:tRNA-Thr(GGU) m(6)t(6)A37 methyltransferase TsaA
LGAIVYRPIGVIHTPFKTRIGMPIQPRGAKGVPGWVEILPEYAAGLQDLEGFSHVILIYHFDQASETRLRVIPYLDVKERGVFATRAPVRPNPIGLSVVLLKAVRGAILDIESADILDGTPLLDIKPHVPEFDCFEVGATGWMGPKVAGSRNARSDDRFG